MAFKDVVPSDSSHLSLQLTYATGQRDGGLEASPVVAWVRLEVHYHPVGGRHDRLVELSTAESTHPEVEYSHSPNALLSTDIILITVTSVSFIKCITVYCLLW